MLVVLWEQGVILSVSSMASMRAENADSPEVMACLDALEKGASVTTSSSGQGVCTLSAVVGADAAAWLLDDLEARHAGYEAACVQAREDGDYMEHAREIRAAHRPGIAAAADLVSMLTAEQRQAGEWLIMRRKSEAARRAYLLSEHGAQVLEGQYREARQVQAAGVVR